jgi:hypothetical protein
MEQKDEFYCQVLYPITITKESLTFGNDLTWEEFQGLTEDSKREAILTLADDYLEGGSVKPLIIECIDEELND